MRKSVPTTEAEALRLARKLGWVAERRRDGWFLFHPDGGMTSFHRHTTDHRAWRNIAARLYRTSDDHGPLVTGKGVPKG